jgi:hypothetical protein
LAPALHYNGRIETFPGGETARRRVMKKYLALFATIFLSMVAGAVRAQNPPTPQDDIQMQQPPPDDAAVDQDQNQPTDQATDQNNDPAAGTEQQDAAAQPGVARVSSLRGDVTTQRGDNGEWIAATLNTPVSPGDRVATGDRSRAELQLDFADTVRMSERATVKIAGLTRSQIHLQVGQGLVTYTVGRGAEAVTDIDTPNAAIRPASGEGEFRILVNSDAETQVIIRRGSADISTPQGSTRVDAGQMITIAGTDNPQYRVSQAPARDDWDNWNNDRNRSITNADSWHRTNRYYTGSEDLDPYGRWTTVPDYGQVWVPSVAPGWAPYRAGRWVWEPYFGWTWVSYEPWGWAPYHYGRWLPYGGSWAWWPGPVVAYPTYYPIWSPAYVSFFGFGGGGFGVGFGFGFGFGHVGWLACGPGDWYHPWYGRFGGRGNFVSIHNTTINNFHNGWRPLGTGRRGFSNLNEASRNDHVRSGMSSMDSKSFGRGTVPAHQSGISAAEFHNASMVSGKMPVSPGKGSYSSTSRAANPATIRSASSSSQHFYSAPRSTARAAAETPRSSGATSNQRGSTPSSNARSAQPNIHGNPNSGAATQPHTSAPMTGANRGSSAPSSSARPGWRTFTPPPSNGRLNATNRTNRGGYTPPNSAHQNAPTNPNGGQRYSPPSRGFQPPASARGNSAPNPLQRQYQPPAAQRPFQPPASASRGGGYPGSAGRPPMSASRGAYPGSGSRPPLSMRQPIVRPRSGGPSGSSASRGGSNGGYRGGGGGSSSHGGGGGGGSHKH